MKKVKLENEKHFLQQLNISLILYFRFHNYNVHILIHMYVVFTALTRKCINIPFVVREERSVNTLSAN